NRLKVGAAQRFFSRPAVFTATAYPALVVAMLWRKRPDVYLWEKVRPLNPMPPEYRERYTNVQAEIGLASLPHLEEWTAQTRAHAQVMNDLLAGVPGVRTPYVPDGCEHVYYQYCVYTPDRDELVRRALVRGMDLETMHVDVCASMPLFGNGHSPTPRAEEASHVVQLPVYASLGLRRARRVARTVRRLASGGAPRAG
ncbi:MAG TPA: DegT/DnrJ/EryC1/StrS family aminotransferase, partial [Vicinamibacterales bacterium]|nr:DegT/DnrJ/EryC1/StrS family aminotransferase [Vicinamibacterales bacterium]